MKAICYHLTLTFDLFVILIRQGGPFNTNWSDVSIIIGSKVVSVFYLLFKVEVERLYFIMSYDDLHT